MCDVPEHTTDACWLNDKSEHVPLSSEDLSRWALWVVSQTRLPITILLM